MKLTQTQTIQVEFFFSDSDEFEHIKALAKDKLLSEGESGAER